MTQSIGSNATRHVQARPSSDISSTSPASSLASARSHAQVFPSSGTHLAVPIERDFFSAIREFVKLPSAYHQRERMMLDNLRLDKFHRDELATIAAKTLDLKGKTQILKDRFENPADRAAKNELKAFARSIGVDIHLPAEKEKISSVRDALTIVKQKQLDVSGVQIRMGVDPDSALVEIIPPKRATGKPKVLASNGKYAPSPKTVYLKNVKPREYRTIPGSLSTNITETLLHELVHAAHTKTAGELNTFGMSQASFTNRGKKIAGSVSMYASQSPAEFVAETGTALLLGRSVNQEAMSLYKNLGGPEIL
ncbi:hypothetical protein [Agarilytica rhodophyticola]|uniref:hypothetical protein n=1 Tax=Agarilytica rhodophyticola TaxID=1737490 RepID=UPI000B3417BF|nr:hypothetical protein [Agarilytica rhodophyticola]